MLKEQKPCQPVVLHDRVVVVGSVQVQSVELVEGVRQTWEEKNHNNWSEKTENHVVKGIWISSE